MDSMTAGIGEWLINTGKLNAAQLERVRSLQTEKGGPLAPLLVQLGFVSERELATTVAEATRLPLAERDDYADVGEFPDLLSPDFLRQYHVAPLRSDTSAIEMAAADPSDTYVGDALSLACGQAVTLHVGVISEIQEAIDRAFPDSNTSPIEARDADMIVARHTDDIAHLRDMASEAPVIRRVNQMVTRALELRASDIHIEPFEHDLVVRYRVDGVLRRIQFPGGLPPEAIVSRIKVLASLDIAERRLPQDGRIKLRAEGREIDMRISTVPTLHGESVVMRLLDRGDVPLDFAALGFDGEILAQLNQLLARPHGIMLVTGPTGSGKTTTLYAALSQLNTPDKKILTVEDPVEYQLDGINQIPIRPSIDLTFANALRAILRQDPDVIMIGEMRDIETARIAIQAALTGHKVFSTLHTNDAPSSITRLQDMHVDDYLITSTIDGVLAQRLVRRLCPQCREAYTPPDWLVRELGLGTAARTDVPPLYRARGCDACDHTGYRGRTTVLELLVMNEPLRRAIVERADADTLRQIARANGMIDMRSDGLRKAAAGLTTVDEVERVVQAQVDNAH
ncbi:MAG: type II secretion system ATPase GspE [Gammaproteobacteria bacterium]|nr:type II secretion system ATPase GspE [Gammaproteobacteria bacterium]